MQSAQVEGRVSRREGLLNPEYGDWYPSLAPTPPGSTVSRDELTTLDRQPGKSRRRTGVRSKGLPVVPAEGRRGLSRSCSYLRVSS